MAEPVIPDELWGLWHETAGWFYLDGDYDQHKLVCGSEEAAWMCTNEEMDHEPRLAGVHPREREARIAAERRAEAAERRLAELIAAAKGAAKALGGVGQPVWAWELNQAIANAERVGTPLVAKAEGGDAC